MDNHSKWFRIKDLEDLTSQKRRTIHFYLQEGLLHPPHKTGRTMSYYDEAHLEKLRFITRQKEEGMPLKEIRHMILSMEENNPQAFGNRLGSLFPHSVQTDSPKTDEKSSSCRRPKQEKARKTRECILQTGCDLFRKNGYKSTRINDITRELNIGKGTFYFYFQDKKELFLECAPRLFEELFAHGWGRIREEKDPLLRLEARAGAVMPVLREFSAIIDLCREAMGEKDPKLNKLGKEIVRSIRRPLESDIERGIAMGLFRPVNKSFLSTVMIGVMQSIHYLSATGETYPEASVVHLLFDLIAKGILADEHR